MPRARKPGAPEPKRRSRNGCWPCKGRKVKCGEEHPVCSNCKKFGETCDYSIRLNWAGRRIKRPASRAKKENEKPAKSAKSDISTQCCPSPMLSQPSLVLKKSHTFPSACPAAPPSSHHPPQSFSTSPPQPSTPLSPAPRERGQEELVFQDGAAAMHLFQASCRSSSIHASSAARPALLSPAVSLCSRPAEMSDPDLSRSSSFISTSAPFGAVNSPRVSQLRTHSFFDARGWVGSPLTTTTTSSSQSDDELQTSGCLAFPSPSSPRSGFLSLHDRQETDSEPFCDRFAAFSLPPPAYEDDEERPEDEESEEETTFYGFDFGHRDLDLGKNDDANAISEETTDATEAPLGFSIATASRYDFDATTRSRRLEDYYERPVPICIPRELEPLPSKLLDNPMNLLYFHYFLDHTARVLFPYDDPKSNPFRTLLPRMAVQNDNLLSLLLAYSASHRARLLHHKEPEMRIALWVDDIFPALRCALNDDDEIISNANLATAIMLASLEIVSPTAFGYDIPWQTHLSLARALMRKRIAHLRAHPPPTPFSEEDSRVSSFLWSWFAYLDVLGSLSGPGGEVESDTDGCLEDPDATSPWMQDYGLLDTDTDFLGGHGPDVIDCIMGFTTRCVHLLAQTAELARHCDRQRIVGGPSHHIDPEWHPSPAVLSRAQSLEQELYESLARPSRICHHARLVGHRDDEAVMATMVNDAFHWAGLVHLRRHVLALPRDHPDVQVAVQQIVACVDRISECREDAAVSSCSYNYNGASSSCCSNADAALLFPLFTAGCDTVDEAQRMRLLERVRRVEASGLAQVHRARRLMETVWVTGRPWETLARSEFIG